MQVNILEAKNRLSKLIRSVQAGEEVIIANRGEPVARLVSAKAVIDDEAGARRIADWLRANPLPPHLKRTHEPIEQGIVEERLAWD